jgi:hypothetical protein
MIAVYYTGNVEILNALIKAGAKRGIDKAIMIASAKGDLKAVAALLKIEHSR